MNHGKQNNDGELSDTQPPFHTHECPFPESCSQHTLVWRLKIARSWTSWRGSQWLISTFDGWSFWILSAQNRRRLPSSNLSIFEYCNYERKTTEQRGRWQKQDSFLSLIKSPVTKCISDLSSSHDGTQMQCFCLGLVWCCAKSRSTSSFRWQMQQQHFPHRTGLDFWRGANLQKFLRNQQHQNIIVLLLLNCPNNTIFYTLSTFLIKSRLQI